MSFLENLRARWRRVSVGDDLAREIDEEFRFHLELCTEDNIRNGMDPVEARRDAERRFGDFRHLKQVGLRILGARSKRNPAAAAFAGLTQDVHHSFRSLRRAPATSSLAVFVLALGIGTNTVLFSIVNAVLMRPLPYPEPERLVQVSTLSGDPTRDRPGGGVVAAAYPAVAAAPSLECVSASQGPGMWLLDTDGPPVDLRVTNVSSEMFALLGAAFELGGPLPREPFSMGFDTVGTNLTVVFTHEFWERQFGGDREIVGRTVRLHGARGWWPYREYAVVGVLTRGFQLPPSPSRTGLMASDTDAFVPFSQAWYIESSPITVRARLRPGITLEQAQANLDGLSVSLREMAAEGGPPVEQVVVVPVESWPRVFYGRFLGLLQGVVGIVLLIVCMNVASLLLARAVWRRGEFAVRASLGAGGGKLARHLIVEHLILAGCGGLGGVAIAYWGRAPIVPWFPQDLVALGSVSLDGSVIAFVAALCCLSVLLFGSVPVLRLSCVRLHEALKTAGATTGARHRLLKTMVVSQVALSCVLLVAAGLLLNSFVRLTRVDPGLDPENVLTVTVRNVPWGISEHESTGALYREVLDRIRALPGVVSAAEVERPPFDSRARNLPITIAGKPLPDSDEARPRADFRWVSPGYFRTMRIPIVSGRDFSGADRGDLARVVVVNQTMARRYWPNEDPLGKTLYWGHSDLESGEFDGRYLNPEAPWTVIGVVKDVKSVALHVPPGPQAYRPHTSEMTGGPHTFLIRSDGDPTMLAGAVRAAISSVDEDEFRGISVSALGDARTALVAESRLYTVALGLFAGLALILALVGLYGVVSYLVSWRTQEIGVRMAIGAQAPEVVRQFLGQGMALVAIGTALGSAGAIAVTRLLRAYLYEVSPTDPVTFAAILAFITLVTLAATLVPARRATRVDPVDVLKAE